LTMISLGSVCLLQILRVKQVGGREHWLLWGAWPDVAR
jgi:hypothetical protein